MTESNFKFFSNATEPRFSNPLVNTAGNDLYLEVSGEFTSCELKVYGVIGSMYTPSDTSNLTELAGINMTSLTVAQPITAKGVYAYSVAPFAAIVVELVSTDGSVEVFGRTTR